MDTEFFDCVVLKVLRDRFEAKGPIHHIAYHLVGFTELFFACSNCINHTVWNARTARFLKMIAPHEVDPRLSADLKDDELVDVTREIRFVFIEKSELLNFFGEFRVVQKRYVGSQMMNALGRAPANNVVIYCSIRPRSAWLLDPASLPSLTSLLRPGTARAYSL